MINRVLMISAAFALAACETGKPYGTIGGGRSFATGSRLEAELSRADRAALEPVFLAAIAEGESGAAKSWRGENAQGAVTPGRYLIANLKPDGAALLPVAAPVSFAEPMETELGLHAIKSTANIRSAPSTEGKVIGQFVAGEAVDAVGKVVGKPWLLVAANGEIRGYVHQSLAIKAPGTEFELAGGPTRRAQPCRAFEQKIAVNGRSDEWSGVACDRGDGWRVEAPPPAAPERLY